jgi:outer membrane protein OmpA-like peptidoglycan-associated protein
MTSTKLLLLAAGLLLPASVFAQSAPQNTTGNATDDIKSAAQIRCELVNDCKPLPASRRWIDPLAGPAERTARTGTAQASATAVRAQPARIAPTKMKMRVGPKIIEVSGSGLWINFASGSAAIDETGFMQATELYSALRPDEWATGKFEISGHTDAVGSAPFNRDLSAKRAQALADFLVAKGVDRSRLIVHGFGYARPLVGIERVDPKNRRVDIVKLK